MRLISPGANPPADVDRYLLPHEQEVITVRKHPAVLLAPVAWAVIGLVLAAVLSDTLLRHESGLTWIVWAIWGLVFLRFLWAALNWSVDYFIVTSHRFIVTSGLFTRNVAMMPLAKVTDMTFRGPSSAASSVTVRSSLSRQARTRHLSTWTSSPTPNSCTLRFARCCFPAKDGGD